MNEEITLGFWQTVSTWLTTSDSYTFTDVTSLILPGSYGLTGLVVVGIATVWYKKYKIKTEKDNNDSQRKHEKEQWEFKRELEEDRLELVKTSVKEVKELSDSAENKISEAKRSLTQTCNDLTGGVENTIKKAVDDAVHLNQSNVNATRTNLEQSAGNIAQVENQANQSLDRIKVTEDEIERKKSRISQRLGRLKTVDELTDRQVDMLVE